MLQQNQILRFWGIYQWEKSFFVVEHIINFILLQMIIFDNFNIAWIKGY